MSTSSATRKFVIEPRRPFQLLDWRELAEYRDLLLFLTWRDIAVRYKQSVLGWFWAFLQPLSQVLVYSVVFGVLLRVSSAGVPYPLFVLSGVIAWTYFTNVVGQASSSLVVQQEVITKVYFPRLLVPLTPTLAYLADLCIALSFTMLATVIWLHRLPMPAVLLPLFVVLLVACSVSVGTLLAALNVRYRDIRQGATLILQLGVWVTPVIWPLEQLQHKAPHLYWLIGINPIATVVQGFRFGLLGQSPPPLPMLVLSIATTLSMLIISLWIFHRVEDVVADIV